ncbi:MAG: 4Fe-4S binding protein [Candidatus Bathyarchaeota archaeon]
MKQIKIQVFPEKCTGCLRCQLICSFAYEGVFNPLKAKIVVNWVDGEISFKDECTNCGSCVEYCGYGALKLVEKEDGK